MSDYVVIARMDQEVEKRIMALREKLGNNGFNVSDFPPHITLAAYENVNEEDVCAWVSEFSSKNHKQKIAFKSLSTLPPGKEVNTQTAVLCLNPAHSKDFVNFYYAFHEKLEKYCTGIGYYNSISHGYPVIHSTIAVVNTQNLQKALEFTFAHSVFGEVNLIALEVYIYPLRLIRRFELNESSVE
jgi:2'-5' RNA ligase